ncbi:transporter [Burkholderia sp. ABCPW 11]|uniref:YadA-like family protein n=1 Tax=Burkholderia sp. ABCPW 11 TaxID=1637859 RepID=UPI00075B0CFB|nr:YadA-like family protein [Burkholderia sp. ABCPW 11]KVD50022.1 transporter [Burkholderia sp. ABCPW 11]
MNKTYRNIWNAATGTWTAVAETAKSHSKGVARAARKVVVGFAIGSATVGGAFAADICMTEDRLPGSLTTAAECTPANVSVSATAPSTHSIGVLGTNDYTAGGGTIIQNPSTTDNNTVIGAGSTINGQNVGVSNATAIGGATVRNGAIGGLATGAIGIGSGAVVDGGNSIVIGAGARNGNSGSIAVGANSVSTGGNGTVSFGTGAYTSASGAVALGSRARTTGKNSASVGADTGTSRAEVFSVGNDVATNADGSARTLFTRQIVNLAAGTQATDAVNVSQLEPVVSALGGGASIDPNTGAVTGPKYNLVNGGGQSTVGDALYALDGQLTIAKNDIETNRSDITNINQQINDLSSGTLGLVQQSAPGANLTVGANTDGTTVDFTGQDGERKLTGVAAGEVSASSLDAVNGSQLHGVSESVASAIGAGSTVNQDGTITAPSFTVGDGNGGSATYDNVGDVVTNLDGRVTTNEGDIKTLADQIGNGTVGLVQQDATSRNITVAANTDGTTVDFTGTAGERKLTGVAAGEVAAGSFDAVNGSQLHGVSESVASAIGAGSTVNADGSISAPTFTVGDGNGGSNTYHNVGDVVTNLDGRVTTNEGDIVKINNQLESGQIGLVQQDPTTRAITVGAATGGTSVDFAGTAGPRTLSGVANGVNDSDAVTIAQLKATGLIDYTGKELAAVVYDGIDLDSVTFGGSMGTKLLNVAPGRIESGSMDAVNGGQLYAMQQDFENRFSDLGDRVSDLEAGGIPGNPGGPGDGSGNIDAPGSGERSVEVGAGSEASGKDSAAIGHEAKASSDGSTAIGSGSNASGSGGTAIGNGSNASGAGSTAIGQNANATGNNSVALGAGSVADRDNAVSVGSAGNERQITNVAAGTAPTDAVNVQQMQNSVRSARQDAMGGVAAAMAVAGLPQSTQPGRTFVSIAGSTYGGEYGSALGASYMTRDGKWTVKAAVNTSSRGEVGAVIGGGFYW